MITTLIAVLYLFAVAGLSLYGLLGIWTLWFYWPHRHPADQPAPPPEEWPPVTVQLPIYNEKYVICRLIEAAVRLDYPRDRLQIQVIDDSNDETTALAGRLVDDHRQRGIDITLYHRNDRTGYKAGALAAAMATVRGDYVAIFDADFRPQPDFLRRTIPFFSQNPRLGVLQTRWGHLNANVSSLTAAQAIALDKHFVIEQQARFAAALFPKFNGTAGIWRRQCIHEAGGWQDDTVCEDLCLSTRAVLKGWEFRFLKDVVAPAELPASITAYKTQQARWSKGSLQCLFKFDRLIWRSRHRLAARLYALLTMSAYLSHPLMLLLLLLQIPLIYTDFSFARYLTLLAPVGIAHPVLFILGQRALYPDWVGRLRHLPALLLLAIGTAPSNTRALGQVFISRQHPFLRTPKQGTDSGTDFAHFSDTNSYVPAFDAIILIEIALALYAAVSMMLAFAKGEPGMIAFPAACFLGFSYVAFLGLREYTYHRPGTAPPSPTAPTRVS